MKALVVGTLKLALSLCVIALAFVFSFRVMNAMMVYDGAQVLIDDAYVCPVERTPEEVCLVRGSLGHELWSGDAIITAGEKAYIIPREMVRGTVFQQRTVRYEPFGQVVSAVIGFAILVAGGFLALWVGSAGFVPSMKRLMLRRG